VVGAVVDAGARALSLLGAQGVAASCDSRRCAVRNDRSTS
jgi:hypothetical protein